MNPAMNRVEVEYIGGGVDVVESLDPIRLAFSREDDLMFVLGNPAREFPRRLIASIRTSGEVTLNGADAPGHPLPA